MSPERRAPEREGGFTLIEVVIAVFLSGILMTGLSTAFVAMLRGTASAHDKFIASNGSHTFSTYFTADVESANPDFVDRSAGAPIGCLSEPPTSTNVLRLQWSEMTTATQLRAFSVSYRILASDTDGIPGNDTWKLVRYACSASQVPFTTSMTAVLAGAQLQSHVLVSDLHEPTGSYVTTASINPLTPELITLVAYASRARNETTPFSYSFSAKMRTPEPVPHVLDIQKTSTSPTNAVSVGWTVTFSEAVRFVDAGDFTFFYSGSAAGAAITSVSGSGTTYTVQASTGTGTGLLALTVSDNDTIVSEADGDRLGGTGTGNGNYTGGHYSVDRTAPSVSVTQATGQLDPTGALPILFTATFDEDVTGLGDQTTDIVNAGTAPDATFAVSGTGKTYTISVSGLTGNGTVRPSIVSGAARDSIGNGNNASTSGADPQVDYNTAAPSITITDVRLTHAGTGSAGRLTSGDTVGITFSNTIAVNTVCSTWSGTGPSSSGWTVTVTRDGAASGQDLLQVTGSSGCTFNFGSINLGGSWVDVSRTFTGGTLGFDSTNMQLTLTFGPTMSGTGQNTNNVPNSTPIYTADPDLQGAAGGSVTTAPTPGTSSGF